MLSAMVVVITFAGVSWQASVLCRGVADEVRDEVEQQLVQARSHAARIFSRPDNRRYRDGSKAATALSGRCKTRDFVEEEVSG